MQNPLAWAERHNLAVYLYAAGRYDEAVAQYLQTEELKPASGSNTAELLAFTRILQGRFEDAHDAIQRLPESPARLQGLALL